MRFYQVDRGQKVLPLQAASIQLARLAVRCRYQCYSTFEQRGKEVAQNHRVRDIHYRELVETNDSCAFGKTVRGQLQGVRVLPE